MESVRGAAAANHRAAGRSREARGAERDESHSSARGETVRSFGARACAFCDAHGETDSATREHANSPPRDRVEGADDGRELEVIPSRGEFQGARACRAGAAKKSVGRSASTVEEDAGRSAGAPQAVGEGRFEDFGAACALVLPCRKSAADERFVGSLLSPALEARLRHALRSRKKVERLLDGFEG